MGSTPDLNPVSPYVALDFHPAAAPLPLIGATSGHVSNCEVAE